MHLRVLLVWFALLLQGFIASAQGTFVASNNYTVPGATQRAFILTADGAPYPKSTGRVAIVDGDGNYLNPSGNQGQALTLDGLFFLSETMTVPGVPTGGTATVFLRFWDSAGAATYELSDYRVTATVVIRDLGGQVTPPRATFAANSNFEGFRVWWQPPVTSSSNRYRFQSEPDGSLTVISAPAGPILEVPATWGVQPVRRLGTGVFADRTDLTAVTLPASLIEIRSEAFKNCGNLSELVIPEGVTRIGASAFENMTNLVRIVFPPGLTELNTNLLRACVQLTNVSLPNTLLRIGARAFQGCTALESLTLPEGLVELGDQALSRSGVTELRFPDSLSLLGREVFADCNDLAAITVASANPSFSSVDGILFTRAKDQIVYVPLQFKGGFTIPQGVRDLPTGAFQGVTGLTSVHLPAGMTNLPDRAFQGCSLTEVAIPGSVVRLGRSVFQGCPLRAVQLDPGLRFLGASAFENCGELPSILLPESLEEIEASAFLNCVSLRSIVIPDSVRRLGPYVFGGCDQLSSISLPRTLSELSTSVLADCRGLTQIKIPPSVVMIGPAAFSGCTRLQEVSLPAGLRFIGINAFQGCESLSRIYLPSSVESISASAFSGCESLRDIFVDGPPPVAGERLQLSLPAIVHYPADIPGWGETFAGLPTRPWFPEVSVDRKPAPDAPMEITVHWAEGRTVLLEASPRLNPTVWTPVSTQVLTDHTARYQVSTTTAADQQFHRVVVPKP
ncbi:MAG: leucine-rich repeat domain-containing protein [Verrucomicrobia bacterium]|nr:leucine-rich repeat domain-containing protein [Verrucomicrobiota bacterium]